MRACPRCGEAMIVAQSITVGGLENKDIAWQCDRDGITAELRHPVQYVHINVGDVDEVAGRRRQLVHKEIRGAELVVYHEWLAPVAPDAPGGPGAEPGRREPTGGTASRRTSAKPRGAAKRRTAAKSPGRAKRAKAGPSAAAGRKARPRRSRRRGRR